MIQLLVIAKAPVAGKSKTRLTPPLSPEGAASLAEASLNQTLQAVVNTPALRRVLVLEGQPGDWLPSGIEVLRQRGDGLDERLTNAFADAGVPSLLIGMDTPQVTPEILTAAVGELTRQATDAVIGESNDGGWWALGLNGFHRGLFAGIPISTAQTGRLQLDRLHELGFRTRLLPKLRDVDSIQDAVQVAKQIPNSPFALELDKLQENMRAKV